MKSLIESIHESTINESADKAMKSIFGKDIKFSERMSSKFRELGMDYQHIDDTFVIYEDGRIEYRNKWLFTIPRTGKVRKTYLNRIIPANDNKVFVLNATLGRNAEGLRPYRFLRAVLNAFPQGYVEITSTGGIINDLDYTEGDYKKDLEEYDIR